MLTKEYVLDIITTQSSGNIEESNFKKKFPELYQEIINLSFPPEFKWTQKLYHYFHDDLELNLGLCPVCGKRCNFESFGYGYKKHCSRICLGKDEEVKNHREETNLKLYGGVGFASKQLSNKQKETMLEIYGVDNYFKTNEHKIYISTHKNELNKIKEETYLYRYGVKWGSQSERFRKNIRITWDNKTQNEIDEITKKHRDNFNNKTEDEKQKLKEKRINYWNNLSKEEHKKRIIKIFNTKRKNKTLTSSKIEKDIIIWLKENNINFKYQYYSNLYPYRCDFYFPDYNLYIEIQGHWTHGKHPFDETNINDINKLNKWFEKSKKSKFYKQAINIWTCRDVKKRKTAELNNLNYLEIFSYNLNECLSIIKNKILL